MKKTNRKGNKVLKKLTAAILAMAIIIINFMTAGHAADGFGGGEPSAYGGIVNAVTAKLCD